MNRNVSLWLALPAVLVLLAACKSETKTEGADTSKAEAPLAAGAPAPAQPPVVDTTPRITTTIKRGDTTITPSGLKYIDTKMGTGPSPKPGQNITVNYTGKFTNGKTFDSNVDPNFHHVEPFKTQIGTHQVIAGWDEGMLTMKVGGKRRLIVPPDLGYGAEGNQNIPPNSTLIFDVELLKVE